MSVLALSGLRLPLAEFELVVDLEIAGRTAAVCGASGAGKTSLLETIAGLRRPRAGRIELGGRVLTDTATGVELPPRQRRVGWVPQDLALFPHLSAGGNLSYAKPAASDETRDRVVDVLELGSLLDRRVGTLSGGERRRVAVGRALLSQPDLLLLDEPLSGLDRRLKDRVLDHLRRVRDELRTPLLLVSHDAADVEALCDEAIVLERGRVVEHRRATTAAPA